MQNNPNTIPVCSDCEEEEEGLRYAGDALVCEECIDANYVECERCGDLSACWSWGSGFKLCDGCN